MGRMARTRYLRLGSLPLSSSFKDCSSGDLQPYTKRQTRGIKTFPPVPFPHQLFSGSLISTYQRLLPYPDSTAFPPTATLAKTVMNGYLRPCPTFSPVTSQISAMNRHAPMSTLVLPSTKINSREQSAQEYCPQLLSVTIR